MTEQQSETPKSKSESSKQGKNPRGKKALPEKGWRVVYGLGGLVFVIVLAVAVSWEKVIEPRLGFDLPDGTRDVDTAEYMSVQPSKVGHIMAAEEMPLAPLSPAPPPVSPTNPMAEPSPGLGQILDVIHQQVESLMARTPFHRHEEMLRKLTRIQVLEGAIQGHIPPQAIGDFLGQDGFLPLPPSLNRLVHLKTRDQLVYEVEAPLPEKQREKKEKASFWDSFKGWAASFVHVEKEEGVSREDLDNLKHFIAWSQWIEALQIMRKMDPEWRAHHGELENQIEAHLDLEHLLQAAYRDLLERPTP